jgi:hypothetical protein
MSTFTSIEFAKARERTMNQVLEGKGALVAGATRGAGRGIAVELGAAGATGKSCRLRSER